MYSFPHQFEPLLPQLRLEELRERAASLCQDALALAGKAHPTTLDAVRELVRAMNSYYSNRIEDQSTSPANIERALRREFSPESDTARLQRLALAHIEAEQELEDRARAEDHILSISFAKAAHHALYSRLAPEDRMSEGRLVEPGETRKENVDVGRHLAPAADSLSGFFQRFDEIYDRRRSWDMHVIATACAHHRFAWVHPFLDGNGRAARLQTHCALWPLSQGLWSVNRGLARRRSDYYARLANADAARRGDLDGRGNLTEAGLHEWVDFFLSVCEDQVSYMRKMLDLDEMKRRLEALVAFRTHDPDATHKTMRSEAVLPLHYAFTSGPMTRSEFSQMTGLGERTARTLLSYLLATGLLVSDTRLGPVRLGLPLDALQFLFPALYPEAAQGTYDT
ncbi:MAG: Fic family protein [Burkholderiaceae bacterium]